MNIHQSARAYESWLAARLGSAFVASDLAEKHVKMRESAFGFLRATYWRWAEIALEACPTLIHAPSTLCVGDIHLENFGTWRDADGRLVWGVNDYDETARMPFALDLVRLATSTLLARKKRDGDVYAICAAILAGYAKGLRAPSPIVLDKDMAWLRRIVEVGNKARAAFWQGLPRAPARNTPKAFVAAIDAALPERNCTIRFSRRVAGAGSLGRLRIVGMAEWRGAPVVREAKALAPSGWTLTHASGPSESIIAPKQAATGAFRAPDPWMAWREAIVVRRLSPNNRKIEAKDELATLLRPDILAAMGHDLASIHSDQPGGSIAIRRYLSAARELWLADAAMTMADAISAEYRAYEPSARR